MNSPTPQRFEPSARFHPASPVPALAREFSRRVCLALTPDELLEVRISNSEERDPEACHTFRFCRPESLLDEASRAVGIELPSATRDPLRAAEILQIRDDAWKLARACRFVEGSIR